MRRDRAKVFAGTRQITQPEVSEITRNVNQPEAIREIVGNEDLETITTEYQVEQSDRKPLHPEVKARIKAAKAIGVKVLKAVPRCGAFQITDPTEDWYLKTGEGADLKAWIDKAHEVALAIESRGVGFAQVKALGASMNTSGPTRPWFQLLAETNDIHKQREVERAFSEWADGDSLAAHVAYGLDIFCSEDVGKSNATNSVLDPTNRAWLNKTYGVQFMTFEQLASYLAGAQSDK